MHAEAVRAVDRARRIPPQAHAWKARLMLNTMRERMPGANVPLPYGGRVAWSDSLAYERNDWAGSAVHTALSAPARSKNSALKTPLDATVLIGMYLDLGRFTCPPFRWQLLTVPGTSTP